jgi:NADH:ubiquinone oxidoreductase subunit C
MTIIANLPEAEWTEKGGALWMSCAGKSVREVAKAMIDVGARFITITAHELPEQKGFRLEYHWDLDGRVLGFTFETSGSSVESIYDLCPAVDWIEREVFEGFAIEFTGRDYKPLQLRSGETPGVNLREEVAR